MQLFSEITEELGRWKSTPWFPSFSAERGVALTTTPLLSTTASADVAYLDVALPYVTEQARWGGRASLAASLQQQNTLEVAKRRLADGVDGVADDDVGAGGTGGARSEGASSALRAGFLTSGSGVSADQQGFDSLVASLAGAKAGAGTIFSRQTNFTQEEEEVELGGEVAVAKPGETPAEAQRRKKQEEQEEMVSAVVCARVRVCMGMCMCMPTYLMRHWVVSKRALSGWAAGSEYRTANYGSSRTSWRSCWPSRRRSSGTWK